MDNLALGIGLLIMSIITFYVLPIIYEPVRYSPGSSLAYGNVIASGILFVSGILFTAFAFAKDKR